MRGGYGDGQDKKALNSGQVFKSGELPGMGAELWQNNMAEQKDVD